MIHELVTHDLFSYFIGRIDPWHWSGKKIIESDWIFQKWIIKMRDFTVKRILWLDLLLVNSYFELSMSRNMTKPTKWVRRCPGWSESLLGTQSLCWFFHVAAHIIWMTLCLYICLSVVFCLSHACLSVCAHMKNCIWYLILCATPLYSCRQWPAVSLFSNSMH